ncbi:MAG: hypothetical protein JXR30_00335, partial [Alphaproteobacteria bacterium]|nr:hypothetical protein [Alphaproteobacteria bacterium]
STALHNSEAPNSIKDKIYRKTHEKHPCTLWVSENRENYKWLYLHFIALGNEYKKRYGKIHKSIRELKEILKEGMKYLPKGKQTPFVNCAANSQIEDCDFRNEKDVHCAYQRYLDKRWKSDRHVAICHLNINLINKES